MVQILSILECGLLRLRVLLDVGLRVGQMASARGVAAADRALLEVALKDVASGEGIPAEDAHVGTITSV